MANCRYGSARWKEFRLRADAFCFLTLNGLYGQLMRYVATSDGCHTLKESYHTGGTLALLDETDADIQAFALEQLNNQVALFWAEIAEHVSKIEVLYEDANFKDRQLAALVASKVYYYLGELSDSLAFALGAGNLFDISQAQDQYVDTVISQCVDRYIQVRSEGGEEDPRMRKIVEQMLQRCIQDHEYKQALGIALETRRIDILEQVLSVARDATLLPYLLDAVVTLTLPTTLRQTVLGLLANRFAELPEPDYFRITQCYVYLNNASLAADLLEKLLADVKALDDEKALIAYQVAFDLADTATQEFLQIVRDRLSAGATLPATAAEQVHRILTGEESIKLYLEFLYRNNKADLRILKQTRDALEARNSVFHSAVTFANAFANAGTASDQFLRDNLDWLGFASNWSKFSATAALGVLHQGNLKHGMSVVQPYLPPANGAPSVSAYSEGGSLYALGLIHANHGAGVLDFLKSALKDNQNETILHGAALGLGVAGMATGNEEIYDELRTVLYNDSAVAGEASGYAMGLVMLGTASQKAIDEMLMYAHETSHEKIIRGLAVGISFLMYGKQEAADPLIETLTAEKDPILRYGGIYTIAMAYAGTGDNKAVRKLLHVAVSDVNDDVRRAAVIALGFILFRTPSQVPRVVQLLSESYNPNVRYGAALALGISCAGTGLEEAIELLEPMTKDPVDFVRQASCISLAMILVQRNDTLVPKAGAARKIFEKIISDKYEDAMAKLGATLAQGLIDAGGRNVTISMQNKSGSTNMPAVVGLALFTQFWYWFPLAHCASLAFTPTPLIGVDYKLRLPKFEIVSQAKPSLYAYQPQTKPPEEKKVELVKTAVLSTTAKTTARAKNKEKEKESDAMDTDDKAAKGDVSAGDKEPAEPKEPEEPSSERLPNLSRVVPAQLTAISFPPESRFTPVRPVSSSNATKSSKTKRSHGNTSAATSFLAQSSSTSSIYGGGIFVLRDKGPSKEAEYYDFESGKAFEEEPAPPAGGAESNPAVLQVDQTAPIAPIPEPFEYDFNN